MIAFNTTFLEIACPDRLPYVRNGGLVGGAIMPGNLHDLCSTCFYGSACVNRGNSSRRVLECEEFCEGGAPPPTVRANRSKSRSNGQTNGESLQGLCGDCRNRKRCTFRMPEGGVWHCEEYR